MKKGIKKMLSHLGWKSANKYGIFNFFTIINFRKEADDYKKERNVLAHQSTLLMQGLNNDDGLDKLLLLQEIEELKRTLEEERNQHSLDVNSLQVGRSYVGCII